jgi:hypothetical protein
MGFNSAFKGLIQVCKRRYIETTLGLCVLMPLNVRGKPLTGRPLFCVAQHYILEIVIKISADRIKICVGLDPPRQHGILSLSQ